MFSINLRLFQAFPIKKHLSTVGWPSLMTAIRRIVSQLPLWMGTHARMYHSPPEGPGIGSASGPNSEQDDKAPALTGGIVQWDR